jgi:hypothetical protein
VLRGKALDFCLVSSSLSAVMGVMDYVAYTAAQVFMDAFVHRHNREECVPWRVVNWDNWVAEAPQARSSSAMTKFYLTPPEAGRALSQFLTMIDTPQLFVSTGDLQARVDQVIRREEAAGSVAKSNQNVPSASAYPRPQLSSPYEAPRNDIERTLAEIWASMLGVDKVGIHDNFFELGGDSVISIQITAKANQGGLQLTPREAFEHQTVAALATVAAAKAVKESARAAAASPAGARAPVSAGVSRADIEEIRRQLASQIR